MTFTQRLATLGKASVPNRYRPKLRLFFLKAGFRAVPYTLFGSLLILGVICTFFAYAYMGLGPFFYGFGVILGTVFSVLYFAGLNVIMYFVVLGALAFYFNLQIYNRTKEIEQNLPDFLSLVSANLKGGLPFDKALWNARKPEFGILAKEIDRVNKRVMTGQSLGDALNTFAQKYESPILNRTMNIIIGQLESGGEISWVLDQVITNLRKTKQLKEEMSANTLTFVIFITAIVVFIAPLLFALAFNLMQLLLDVSADIIPAIQTAAEETQQLPTVPDINVNAENFKTFSFLAIGIISVVSSMIISIIQRGDILGGIKYIPFFVGLSVALYFIFLNALSGLLNFTS